MKNALNVSVKYWTHASGCFREALLMSNYSREPTKLGGHVRIFMSGPRNIYERFMNEKKSTRLAHNFVYEQVASKIVRTFYEHIMSKVRVSESEKKEG